MQRLTAIINGQPATVITPLSRAECAASCRDRFGAKFEGFEDEADKRSTQRTEKHR